MQRLFLGRSMFRYGGTLLPRIPQLLPACQCYHASNRNKKQQKKGLSKSTRRSKKRHESMQDWVEQYSPSTRSEEAAATQETLLPNHASTSAHLEQTKSTFFLGGALALEWTLPSVQTSQHPGVKAILKDIQSRAADAHVEKAVDWRSREAHVEEEEGDWSDENDESGQ